MIDEIVLASSDSTAGRYSQTLLFCGSGRAPAIETARSTNATTEALCLNVLCIEDPGDAGSYASS
jgi:hypothetical protein